MTTLNSLFLDIYRKVTQQAVELSNHGKGSTTLTARDIQSACKLYLPGELAIHAIKEGTIAVERVRKSVKDQKS